MVRIGNRWCSAALLILAISAAPARADEEADIPFAHLGGVRHWRAIDNNTLMIEGRNRQWYQAALTGPCSGLSFAQNIGFVSEPNGAFDRFSAIVVDNHICRVQSLTRTAKPGLRAEGATATDAATR